MVDRIYKLLPNILQNLLVTLHDVMQYRKRHSGVYQQYYNYYQQAQNLSYEDLRKQQLKLLEDFLNFAKNNSSYYARLLNELSFQTATIEATYKTVPVQQKEMIRQQIEDIYTVPKSKSILSKTGGTTGKSLEVRFTAEDMQKRFALLDLFRAEFGYKLGDKVAWFSGKSILSQADVDNNRFWKQNFVHHIRYYSTFHISQHTIKYYIDDLNKYKPLFAVGFPSNMVEIASWGIRNNYPLNYKMKTIFPTAETIVENEKKIIEKFFGGVVRNQYASSEGAPFIIECKQGNLHIEMLSGYFEVLEDNKDVDEGELVFTSFSTHGTPLVRYRIGDRVKLSAAKHCSCGNNNPIIDAIEGRTNDFIYSAERGKINLGNISNCVKYVHGVVKFQIDQSQEDEITVRIVKDETFTGKDEAMFLKELQERLGNCVAVKFEYVPDIAREKSGKYRIVKNTLNMQI